MKICVFQGTFNPIHNSHLRIAKETLERYDYDKIIFIPAYKPPHKEFDKELSEHRLNMVKLAVACEPRFEVSDIEYKSEDVSYTYNTIVKLRKIYKTDHIGFIIGQDAYEGINGWHKAQALKKLVDFIIYPRVDEISSKKIREWIANNSPVDDMVSEDVLCYIREHGLYKNS